MTRSIFHLFFLLFCFVGFSLYANDSIYSETWHLDNLKEISGHKVTFTGSPVVVQTDFGAAMQFNGVKDKILVDSNPIGDVKEFTVEMVFKPDAAFSSNSDPRFLHIQDPNDPLEKRVMMELRIDAKNQCYLDGYIKTDKANLTLIDATLTHPTGVWHHAAITYANDTLTTWFNGKKELSGRVLFGQAILNTGGKTSLGARMNDRNYYKGLIKAIKVTRKAIAPDQFFYLKDLPTLKRQDHLTEKPFSVNRKDNGLSVTLLDQENIPASFTAELYDSTGRRIFQAKNHLSSEVLIPLSEYGTTRGLLYLRILYRDKTYIEKVLR